VRGSKGRGFCFGVALDALSQPAGDGTSRPIFLIRSFVGERQERRRASLTSNRTRGLQMMASVNGSVLKRRSQSRAPKEAARMMSGRPNEAIQNRI